MDPKTARINLGDSMQYVATLLVLTQASDLMVIDDEGRFIGVLSEGDIPRTIMPDFEGLTEAGSSLRRAFEIFRGAGRSYADQPITRKDGRRDRGDAVHFRLLRRSLPDHHTAEDGAKLHVAGRLLTRLHMSGADYDRAYRPVAPDEPAGESGSCQADGTAVSSAIMCSSAAWSGPTVGLLRDTDALPLTPPESGLPGSRCCRSRAGSTLPDRVGCGRPDRSRGPGAPPSPGAPRG